MSVVFKCVKHNFDCESPAEWREHLAKEEHIRRGIAPCNICGASHEFVFSGKIDGKEPSLCESCSTKLVVGKELAGKEGESNE